MPPRLFPSKGELAGRSLRLEKRAIGESFCPRHFPDSTTDKIEDFATEGLAGRRVKNELAAWLFNGRQTKANSR